MERPGRLLVYGSGFLPRFLGIWLIPITQPVALGEVATMLWLVIVGAREQRL